jgi:hypothetical protein
MLGSDLLANNRFIFATPTLDLVTPVSDVPLSLLTADPFPVGANFICTIARFVASSLDGTITTGPTLNAGNDVAKTNLLASGVQLGAAALNSVFASGLPGLIAATSGVNNLNKQLRDPSSFPFKLDITVGAVLNTATQAQGRWLFGGFVFP